MIDRILLPTQTDKFYIILSEDYGINPKEFDVKHTKEQFKITHIQTGFFFETICPKDHRFPHNSITKFVIEFYPTNRSEIRRGHVDSFSGILEQYKIWAKHLARETKQPDYWSILQEEAKSLPLSSEIVASNISFSSNEVDSMKQQLNEIKDFIFSNFKLSRESQSFVQSKLKYLEEYANKSEHGRIDWLNIAIGVLMSIIVGVSLNPEQAKTLINFFGKALSPLFGGSIPLLP